MSGARRSLRAFVVAAVIAAPVTATALMAPKVYEDARKQAPIHAQIGVGALTTSQPSAAKAPGLGYCHISGPVLRIFRDDTHTLSQGETIGFDVACRLSPMAHPDPGVDPWQDLSTLKIAKVMEVYAQRNGENLAIVHAQVTPLAVGTDTPACPDDTRGIICAPGFMSAPIDQ